MGNSEVGHLNIGAGRVVYQDFTRIDHAIATGEFAANPVLVAAADAARDRGTALHVLGLLSPGGVHSHERQIAAMVELAAARGVRQVCVHAFLDGRDTPPRSAAASLAYMEARVRAPPGRADRVGRRPVLRDGPRPALGARRARLPPAGRRRRAVHRATRRRRRSTPPTRAARATSSSRRRPSSRRAPGPATIADGDVVVFMNFRADRARQMTRALTDPAFAGFPRSRVPRLSRVRVPHVVRRGIRGAAGGVRAADDPERLRRVPRRASG